MPTCPGSLFPTIHESRKCCLIKIQQTVEKLVSFFKTPCSIQYSISPTTNNTRKKWTIYSLPLLFEFMASSVLESHYLYNIPCSSPLPSNSWIKRVSFNKWSLSTPLYYLSVWAPYTVNITRHERKRQWNMQRHINTEEDTRSPLKIFGRTIFAEGEIFRTKIFQNSSTT